jgi:hypothetical protein
MGSRHTSSLALRRSEHLIAQVKLALLDQGKDRHRGDGLFVTLAMRKMYVVLTRPSQAIPAGIPRGHSKLEQLLPPDAEQQEPFPLCTLPFFKSVEGVLSSDLANSFAHLIR